MADTEKISSAIYIDFDNVHTALREHDLRQNNNLKYSNLFLHRASDWLRLLEDGADGGARRNFLIKRCYFNTGEGIMVPLRMGGFETISCPSMTRQGKSGADMQMALDIYKASLNVGQHAPVDEFIIFSGDADFTPLLTELRGNNKQGTILTLGPISAAYRNVSHQQIDNFPAILEQLSQPASTPSSASGEVDMRGICSGLIKACMGDGKALPMATLEQKLKTCFAEHSTPVPWSDTAGLHAFINDLAPAAMRVKDELLVVTGSSTADATVPQLSAPVAPALSAAAFTEDAVYQLAKRVHDLIRVPLLSPEDYAALFETLAEQLNAYGLSDDLNLMAEQLQYQGAASPRDAVFVLRGLQLSGHRFVIGEESGQDLAEAFLGSVLYRCRTRARLYLTEQEQVLLKQWLLGSARDVPRQGFRVATASAVDLRERCMEKIRLVVIGRAEGMELYELGGMIQDELPNLYNPGGVQSKWGGQPTLTKMLLSFGLNPLMLARIDERLSIIYDPAVQDAMDRELVVTPLLQEAGVPLLDSVGYGHLFNALHALINDRDALPSMDFLVGSLAELQLSKLNMQSIDDGELREILNTALIGSGYRLRRGQGQPAALARYFATQVLKRCRYRRPQLGNRELVSTYHWIVSGASTVAAPPAAYSAVPVADQRLDDSGAVTRQDSRATARVSAAAQKECMEKVWLAVRDRAEGKELSELGIMIQHQLPDLFNPGSVQFKWGGKPTLNKMLVSFGLGPLMVAYTDKPPIIYDPAVQEATDMRSVVTPLLQEAGVPLLDSVGYGHLFNALYAVINDRDALPSMDFLAESLAELQLLKLNMQSVDDGEIRETLNTSLIGSGYDFRRGQGDPVSLARCFAMQVLKRCRNRWPQLSNRERVAAWHWITSRCGTPTEALGAVAVR